METPFQYVEPGAGTVYRVLGGDVITVKATAEETGGGFTLFETVVPPQGVPSPHVHHREDEAFYLLEGELDVTVGGQTVWAVPGSYVWGPRDVPHRFRNVGATPARMLVIIRPAGFEHFIAEFSQLNPDAPPDFAAMSAIATKFGLEFLSD